MTYDASLLLVKHSLPAIDPAAPARTWRLSDEGRRRCASLAAALAPYRPDLIVASQEPKAAETAELVAGQLGLAWQTAAGLHEHERDTAGWLGPAAFEQAIADLFANPTDLVFGEETAAAAQARFAAAVDRLLAEHPDQTLAVVAHGTVIALYAARHGGVEPLPLWRRLGLPSFVALALPDRRIVAVVETVPAV